MRALVAVFALLPTFALAQAEQSRVSAAGYFRFAARPDFDGGNGRLGFSNLYGRLLNEGAYAALEVKIDLLQAAPGTSDLWASAHARIEGGSVPGADLYNGALSQFRISQLYTRVGNLLLKNVTWQLGTLIYFFGDLGLYDFRPATVFDDTMGLSARYQGEKWSLLLGVGDAGFFVRGLNYSPLLTAGGALRIQLGDHVEIGGGGQVSYEPAIEGSRNSPYQTPDVNYEDYLRHEVAQRWVEQHPGEETLFPHPQQATKASVPWRTVGYLGFGKLGPLIWNNFFLSYKHLPNDQSYVETYAGRQYTIYTADVTDERYQLQMGNEMQLRVIPGRLDLAWGVLYGQDVDYDNAIAAKETNRQDYSTVLRAQLYVTKTVHVLLEGSLAEERSANGNLFREHYDSIFASTGGASDSRGFEFGNSAIRRTMQLKGGIVLNPTGIGVYARPSLRLMYGAQYSSQQAAFGNSFSDSLDQFNAFPGTERHWHHLISLEAEGWF